MSSRRSVYQQGDHVCTLYESKKEQLVAAVEYIVGGLSRGERCLYVCGEHTPTKLRAALSKVGVDVSAAEKRGALLLIEKDEAHLSGGVFDPDKMISLLHRAVDDALKAGFEGLCAAGDMCWVLDAAPGTEKLAEYEARLNDFYSKHRALGLCQYNRNSIPEPFLDHCIATHPVVRIDGVALRNPFYESPRKAMHRSPARSLRVQKKLSHFDHRNHGRRFESPRSVN